MSSAVAPNRGVSATILLMLVVTGGCLAMASAVPVANGRRLQQLAGSQINQVLALESGFQKLIDQLQGLLQTVPTQDNLRGQLQQVMTSLVEVQSQLQGLLNLQMLNQPESATVLGNLLNQIAVQLDTLLKQFQNAQPVGGCFTEQQAAVIGAISALGSRLKSTTASFPMQLVGALKPLFDALENLEKAVVQVDPCAPGLDKLRINGLAGVLAIVSELLAIIQ